MKQKGSGPLDLVEGEPRTPLSLDARERVWEQLDRIAKSAIFHRARRAIQVLRLIIERDFEGKPLTEREIGQLVFGLSEEWDPRIDPIVRIAAGRLRSKLEEYYADAGAKDPVVLEVPKGGYAPRIKFRGPTFELPAAIHSSATAPMAPPPTPAKQSRGHLAALSWLGLGLTLAAVVAFLFHGRNREVPSAYSVRPFANDKGQQYGPVFSPDGNRIAYVKFRNINASEIMLRDVAGTHSQPFTSGHTLDINPAWSPDGKSIAFLRFHEGSAEIIVKSLNGSPESFVGKIDASERADWVYDSGPQLDSFGPVWDAAGKSLFIADAVPERHSLAIFRIDIQTGVGEQITHPSNATQDFFPRISHDGSELAFVRYTSHGVAEIYLHKLGTASPSADQKQTSFGRGIRGLTWGLRDRHLIFSSNHAGSYELYSLNLRNRQSSALPSDSSSAADPSLSPDGLSLAFVEEHKNWNIWRAAMGPHTMAPPEVLISSSGLNDSPSYSPDGSAIAYASDRSGFWEMWKIRADGTNPVQLTHLNGSWAAGPSWSRDGKWIAFDGRTGSHSQIHLVSSDGRQHQVLQLGDEEDRRPIFSRAEDAIYFTSDRSGEVAVWKIDLASRAQQRITSQPFFAGGQANDKQTLYLGNEEGEVYEQSIAGGPARLLVSGVRPRWAWTPRNGNLLFAGLDNAGRTVIKEYDGRSSREVGVAPVSLLSSIVSLAASPDGKWLLLTAEDEGQNDIKLRKTVQPLL